MKKISPSDKSNKQMNGVLDIAGATNQTGTMPGETELSNTASIFRDTNQPIKFAGMAFKASFPNFKRYSQTLFIRS
jgi:hypothetical protein